MKCFVVNDKTVKQSKVKVSKTDKSSELVTNINYSCQTEIQIFLSKDSCIF